MREKNVCMQSQKKFILKFKPIYRTDFAFLKAIAVHKLWPVSISTLMTATKRTVNLELSQFSSWTSRVTFNGEFFVSYIC